MGRTMLLLVAIATVAAPLGAQRPQTAREDRATLEKRFHERLEAVLRQRLGLTDDQVRRLQDANGRFEARRRDLFTEERQVRTDLRRAVGSDSATATNDEVAALLDRAMRVQRQRFDLMEAEQKELATFLTPIQRARYFGLLEQVRRQMDDMRYRREDSARRSPSPVRRPYPSRGGP
ncbi:MAG: hypothetical protein IT361_17500 [Gemmatimonadaceae bacterium]|nr:hypothetical protein [Gemmatimonadaceae bacterium]